MFIIQSCNKTPIAGIWYCGVNFSFHLFLHFNFKQAVIASHGKLTPNFEYIADLRAENRFVYANSIISCFVLLLTWQEF